MCGIIGFTGTGDVMQRLINGLDVLEYRGYDSVGTAFFVGEHLKCVKSCGRLPKLIRLLEDIPKSGVTCGIGHTRWATHGRVAVENAHPHGNERLYGVHNGTIENCSEIEKYLTRHGYTFASETDTERAVLLIDLLYRKYSDPLAAMRGAFDKLRGSFAFGLLFYDKPGEIYAMRRESPLLVCRSDSGYYISSDLSAPMDDAFEYAELENGETAVLRCDGAEFYGADGGKLKKNFLPILRAQREDTCGEYEHFMLREICEEGMALSRALEGVTEGMIPSKKVTCLSEERIRRLGCIHIIGCGTAMHAGILGKYVIERMARVRVNVEIASEFRSREPILDKDDIVLVISQSGETADTVAAMRLAANHGIFTLAVVNAQSSTVAREADAVIYMNAGPERSVASTKAYTVQVAVLYLMAIRIAAVRRTIDEQYVAKMCKKLCEMPKFLERTPQLDTSCQEAASICANAGNIFFIGRG